MDDSLSGVDFTALELAPAVRELVQRLLNCIETLVTDLNEAQAEMQRLRDELARLKGEKGKPKFKANGSPDPDDDDDDSSRPAPDQASGKQPRSNLKPQPGTNSGPSVPWKARIAVDREEVVKLDRSQLPPDVSHRGYRDVIIQNIVFETATVLHPSWSSDGLQDRASGQAPTIPRYTRDRLPRAVVRSRVGAVCPTTLSVAESWVYQRGHAGAPSRPCTAAPSLRGPAEFEPVCVCAE